jgi:hypothetical protein
LEQQLWQRLGIHLADLETRPWREVEEYLLYIELIVSEEQAQQAAARRSRGAGG